MTAAPQKVRNRFTESDGSPIVSASILSADFARLVDTDLSAGQALIRLVVPGMVERGWGRLILVTSIAATLAAPGASSYIAAKAGLEALARALASELGATGVTSNALSPGFFATETNEALIASAAGERMRPQHSTRRCCSAATVRSSGSAAGAAPRCFAGLTRPWVDPSRSSSSTPASPRPRSSSRCSR